MGAALGALLPLTPPLVAASCLPGSSFCEKPTVDPNSGTLEAADLLEAPEHFSFSRGNWGRAARQLQAAQQLRAAAMPSEEQRGGADADAVHQQRARFGFTLEKLKKLRNGKHIGTSRLGNVRHSLLT